MAPRLKEKYVSEIREALRAEFKHENVMHRPPNADDLSHITQ